MKQLRQWFSQNEERWQHPLAKQVTQFYCEPTQLSSKGFPQTTQQGFQIFRDSIPHLLGMGHQTSLAANEIQSALNQDQIILKHYGEHLKNAHKLFSTLLNTASVTAPPELWLLKNVLSTLGETNLLNFLIHQKKINICSAQFLDKWPLIHQEELKTDLRFLESRGYLKADKQIFTIGESSKIHDIFERASQWQRPGKERFSAHWAALFSHEKNKNDFDAIREQTRKLKPRDNFEQQDWVASVNEIESGAWLVPFILGLKLAKKTASFCANPITFCQALHDDTNFTQSLINNVIHLGLSDAEGSITAIGQRICTRGPGPFGIIYAYHPYMASLNDILQKGRGAVWVRRKDNIAASQLANTKTFSGGNLMLDKFCDEHAFTFNVFIEHALGKGEATRQRFEKNGENNIQFIGADLENDAIDAAIEEQENGNIPQNMVFVREADIGQPDKLLSAMKQHRIKTQDAVMMVGNGFHEVRDQTTQKMIDVFHAYHESGIILIFTEETGHGTSLLQDSAWNTYHSGFRYVHEKSGQGLRPAHNPPQGADKVDWPESWHSCVTQAGYVYMSQYTHATRNVFPFKPKDGFNPSISVTHFCVPGPLARRLKIIG